MTVSKLTIRQPDDMHLHLRDGLMMSSVIKYTARVFGRAIIMPNLNPPLTNSNMVAQYHKRIEKVIAGDFDFKPLMTLYLTEDTSVTDLENGFKDKLIKAVKLYPAGATTNSDSGVNNISKVMPVLEKMAKLGIPLLVHGEVTDHSVDIFDKESVFIDKVLEPLVMKLPELKIVLEHITTSDAVDFLESGRHNVHATITPHHLSFNRNIMFTGGINPHYYCLPVLKAERHRVALVSAATSGDKKYFLGTDSAPHSIESKESSCGCAGIFNSYNAIEILATIFENEDKIYNLERFCSINGSEFYGLEPNQAQVEIVKKSDRLTLPDSIRVGDQRIKVFDPGFPIFWHVDKVMKFKRGEEII